MREQPGAGAAVGSEVRAVDGPAGVVAAVAVDPRALRATWLLVALHSGRRIAVPSPSASVDASGAVLVPFTLDRLASSPAVAGDVIDPQLAAEIAAHLGMPA